MPNPTVTRTHMNGTYTYRVSPAHPALISTTCAHYVYVNAAGNVYLPGTQPDEQATKDKLWCVLVSVQIAYGRGVVAVLNPDTSLSTNATPDTNMYRIAAEYNAGQCTLQQAFDDLLDTGYTRHPAHLQAALDTWLWGSAAKVSCGLLTHTKA